MLIKDNSSNDNSNVKKTTKLTYAEKQLRKQLELQEIIDYKYPPIQPYDIPVNGNDLIEEIRGVINKWIVFPNQDKYSLIIALWIVNTYVYDCFENCPILFINSPIPGCGKSTLCDLLYALVYRGLLGQGSTGAALTKKIAYYKVTCILDNYDTANTELQQAIKALYDQGWQRNGQRNICSSGNADDILDLICYGPKVISGLNDLSPTTKTRSIIINLQKSKIDIKTKITSKKYVDMWYDIKRKITRWTNDHLEQLNNIDFEALLKDNKLDPRQMDIWTPLITLASLTGYEKEIEKYSIECSDENGEKSKTWKVELLTLLYSSLNDEIEKHIPISKMLSILNDNNFNIEFSNGQPKPNSGRKLIKILETFGLKCHHKLNGKVEHVVLTDKLKEVFKTYITTTDNVIFDQPVIEEDNQIVNLLQIKKEEDYSNV